MAEEEKNKKVIQNEYVDDDFDDEDDIDDEDLDDEDLDDDEKGTDKSGHDDDKEEDGTEEKKSKKEEQDKNERARQAKARREREAKEREDREKRIREEAYLKGKLDSTKVNTFTEEPIEDEYDLFIFETQKQLEKEGKDPISDLPKRLAEINRKKAKEASEKESEKNKLNEQIDKEFAEFRGKYPTTKISELLQDPDFKDYADGRLGKGGKTLTQLYESFLKLKEKLVGKKEEEEEDDGKRGAPSPNGGRKTQKTSYSDMSEEEKIKELRRQGLIR